jgi:hypothetical protein
VTSSRIERASETESYLDLYAESNYRTVEEMLRRERAERTLKLVSWILVLGFIAGFWYVMIKAVL